MKWSKYSGVSSIARTLEVLIRQIGGEKEIKGMQIKEEEINT